MRPIFLLVFCFSLACGQLAEGEFAIGPENDISQHSMREPTQSEESAFSNLEIHQEDNGYILYGHKDSFQHAAPEAYFESLANFDKIRDSGVHSFLSFFIYTNDQGFAAFNACAYTKSIKPLDLSEVVLYNESISYTGEHWKHTDPVFNVAGLPHFSERVCTYGYYVELSQFETVTRIMVNSVEATINRPLYSLEKRMMTDMLDALYYKTDFTQRIQE